MGSRHGKEEGKEKTFEDQSSAERVGTVWSEGRWCRAAEIGFRTRTREVRHVQDAPAGHRVPGSTRLQGVPAVIVPGHVLGVRVSTPGSNRPWRAEPPVWRYVLGTSATPQVNRVLRHDPTCWRARYIGDGDVVSIAPS
ncbi:hypothetical protein MTO96_049947 [Rhipicephalus appendiculatus]